MAAQSREQAIVKDIFESGPLSTLTELRDFEDKLTADSEQRNLLVI